MEDKGSWLGGARGAGPVRSAGCLSARRGAGARVVEVMTGQAALSPPLPRFGGGPHGGNRERSAGANRINKRIKFQIYMLRLQSPDNWGLIMRRRYLASTCLAITAAAHAGS